MLQTWKNLSFSSGSFNNNSTWSTKLDSGNSTSAKDGWKKKKLKITSCNLGRKKKNNRRETMTRLLAYRALVFLLKDLTCAAQVDTRALILFRCISMVSLSVICSVRHNSRTTWNKILLIKKKTLTKSNYSRDSPGLETGLIKQGSKQSAHHISLITVTITKNNTATQDWPVVHVWEGFQKMIRYQYYTWL